jgi:hypothetical protein
MFNGAQPAILECEPDFLTLVEFYFFLAFSSDTRRTGIYGDFICFAYYMQRVR